VIIYTTGSSGFVGSNILRESLDFQFLRHKRGTLPKVRGADVVLHLAGKAHDTNSTEDAQDYFIANTELTKQVFDAFMISDAKVFIYFSSVKAAAGCYSGILTEEYNANPATVYGKSKLLAENYILSKKLPENKRVYILRPTIIHGPGNKSNLYLLYKVVSKGIPWPLGSFDNLRSFCSISNLNFVFRELVVREDIKSGIYNVCDDRPISNVELIEIISEALAVSPRIWKLPKGLIQNLVKVGDFFHLPLNSERLEKLTGSAVVSNKKLVAALGKQLPTDSRDGLIWTIKSFAKHD
jgi:nucleoside-diphosphate-sugar epimerase